MLPDNDIADNQVFSPHVTSASEVRVVPARDHGGICERDFYKVFRRGSRRVRHRSIHEGVVIFVVRQHLGLDTFFHTRHHSTYWSDPESFNIHSGVVWEAFVAEKDMRLRPVSYTHLRAHETGRNLVCRLL